MRRSLAFFAVLIGLVGMTGTARAAEITVDTNVDQAFVVPGAGCSLRDAFFSADNDIASGGCVAGNGNDVILLPRGVYALTLGSSGDGDPASGDLDFQGTGSIEIQPAQANAKVKIDGTGLDRIFDRVAPGIGDLIIRNLTLTGGNSQTGTFDGGAVRNLSGLFRAEGVAFFGNTAGQDGGAIFNGADLELVNSTVSTNRAVGDGGGIAQSNVGASADLRSVTIAENTADDDGNGVGSGGGIYTGSSSSSFNLLNSIVANNSDSSPDPADQQPDCVSGPSFYPRYSMSTQKFGFGLCLIGFDPGTNYSPANPELGTIGDNGGTTPTYPIGRNSNAANSGGSLFPDKCPPTDQRGFIRTDDQCDLGAFEAGALTPDPLPGRPTPTAVIATFDGVNLFVRLKCPGRFKPTCRSVAVPMTKRPAATRADAPVRPMARPKRVVTRSNAWKVVSFQILPAYRATIEQMTHVDRKQLVIRQLIKSTRVGARKAPRRPATVYHTYKVRVKT